MKDAARRRGAATDEDEGSGEDAGNAQDERAVRDRVGELDAFLVDDHVAGNRQRHAQRERDVAPVGAATDATDDEDTDCHECDAGDLRDRGRRARERHGQRQDEDRRRAARDGVDEAQVGALIGSDEQREVDELQGRRERDVRPCLWLDVPARDRNRRKHERAKDDHDRRRCRAVARRNDDQVPQRVDERGDQNDRESRSAFMP